MEQDKLIALLNDMTLEEKIDQMLQVSGMFYTDVRQTQLATRRRRSVWREVCWERWGQDSSKGYRGSIWSGIRTTFP